MGRISVTFDGIAGPQGGIEPLFVQGLARLQARNRGSRADAVSPKEALSSEAWFFEKLPGGHGRQVGHQGDRGKENGWMPIGMDRLADVGWNLLDQVDAIANRTGINQESIREDLLEPALFRTQAEVNKGRRGQSRKREGNP